MSEEEIADEAEKILKKRPPFPSEDKKIVVEHRFLKEGDNPAEDDPEKLKEKLIERESQLQLLALAEIEREKAKLMEKVPEDKREAVGNLIDKDPKMLDVLKIQFGATEPEDDGTEPVPPKGKAKAQPKPSKDTVEYLYGVLSSNQSTAEQKKTAEQKLDNLWKKAMSDRKTAHKALKGEEE